MTRRTERVGEELRAEVARLLREEVTDPRIGLVTLTRVDVAPDLRSALLFWSCLDPHGDREAEREQVHAVQEGLESAAPFLRRRLAAVVPWKRVPELRFRYDPSLALGSDTLQILREIGDDATES